MKNIRKGYIFSFILGALIFGGIVGASAYSVLANNIGYTPNDSTWKKSNGENITNVSEAIDELYTRSNNNKAYKKLLWTNEQPNQSISQLDITLNDTLEKFSHILIQWHISTSDETMYEDLYSLKPYRGTNSFYSFTCKTSDGSYTRRLSYIDNTTMRIQNTFRLNGASSNNSLAIPYRIYGLNILY